MIHTNAKLVFILLLLFPATTFGENNNEPAIDAIEVTFGNFASSIIDKNNDIHRVWRGYTPPHDVDRDNKIYYQKLHYGSSTWDPVIEVPLDTNRENVAPEIIVDSNNNIHIIWLESSSNLHETPGVNIYHILLNTTNNQWSNPYSIGSYNRVYDLSFTIDSQDIGHVVWSQGIIDGIYYRSYNITSELWSTKVKISTTYSEPVLAIDWSGNIHLISKSGEIYHTMFNNTEKSWGPSNKIITSRWIFPQNTSPTVSVGEDALHLAWVDNDWNITEQVTSVILNYKKYNISTNSWAPTEIVTILYSDINTTRGLWTPILQVDHLNNVHIVWNVKISEHRIGDDHKEIALASYNKNREKWDNVSIVSTNNSREEVSAENFLIDSQNNLIILWVHTIHEDGTSNLLETYIATYQILILAFASVILIRKKIND